MAQAALDKAIEAYTKSFESESRDYYNGINAITLLIQKGDAEAMKQAKSLAPLVRFANQSRWEGFQCLLGLCHVVGVERHHRGLGAI